MNDNSNAVRSVNESMTASIGQNRIHKMGLLKFVIASFFSIFFLFVSMTPGGFNPLISISANAIFDYTQAYLPWFIFLFVMVFGIVSLVTYIYQPRSILENTTLSTLFNRKPFDIGIQIIAILFAGMVAFQIGPALILSENIGGAIIGAAGIISIWMLLFTFIFPIFAQFGLDEFLGTLMQPVMKPLFKVPGVSAMCTVLAFIMGPTMGAVVAIQQHEEGYYTDREASTVIATLIGPHIPAIMLYSSVLNISQEFPKFIFCSLTTIFLTGVIVSRIPPLSRMSNSYINERGDINYKLPKGKKRFNHALERASFKAKNARINLVESFLLILEVLSVMVPFIVALGTLSFIVVYHTPFFDWISYPMGFYLKLLGVDGAFLIAPATLIGIVEGMLPIVLASGYEMIQQKFLIGVLGTTQLIFFTELAVIILSSKVPLRIRDLIILFFERTLIALPIIVLLMKFLY